ncbi:sialidase family protein [Paenibacillus koleovorans]|uniref:sialidase family protein n=1 Tax=Paenibacillus koleovorans TaxID=121608 RepID=UPI0013E3C880|nr:sialidase family protein [Paenibacillus koleovorans]
MITTIAIAKAGPTNPRNDTACIAELPDGRLLAVWHKYEGETNTGSDFDGCRIYAKTSRDGGTTWGEERLLIDADPEDNNVQAPGLCLLPDGTLLLHCLRGHRGANSSSMDVYASNNGGESWELRSRVWERSQGQWLQGGANQMNLLSGGRLLLPFHFGDGHQGKQHNTVGCFYSDDGGVNWVQAAGTVRLPMRGAMEPSVAELASGTLIMSLRSQLGSVFLARSEDRGETWTLPQTSGLKATESCTCIRRIPGTNVLTLFWNDSLYDPGTHHYGLRTPLSAAVSEDEGRTWRKVGDIATGPYAFFNLNCMFTSQGKAILTYAKREEPRLMAHPEKVSKAIHQFAALIEPDWLISGGAPERAAE